jgi:hypothetical protein
MRRYTEYAQIRTGQYSHLLTQQTGCPLARWLFQRGVMALYLALYLANLP